MCIRDRLYIATVADLKEVVEILDGALDLLEKVERRYVIGENVFTEVKTVSTKILKGFTRARVQRSAALGELITVFLALGNQNTEKAVGPYAGVDASQTDRVRELLLKLQDDINAQIEDWHEKERKAVVRYDNLMKVLNDLLAVLRVQANKLVIYISDMNVCVTEEEEIVNTASAKKVRNSYLLERAHDMCAAFEEEYYQVSSERQKELNIIRQILTYIKEKLQNVNVNVVGESSESYVHTVRTYPGYGNQQVIAPAGSQSEAEEEQEGQEEEEDYEEGDVNEEEEDDEDDESGVPVEYVYYDENGNIIEDDIVYEDVEQEEIEEDIAEREAEYEESQAEEEEEEQDMVNEQAKRRMMRMTNLACRLSTFTTMRTETSSKTISCMRMWSKRRLRKILLRERPNTRNLKPRKRRRSKIWLTSRLMRRTLRSSRMNSRLRMIQRPNTIKTKHSPFPSYNDARIFHQSQQ
eukprot:TRINITY_DN635_c0_g1_i8.p1 TRINITY_DN635_c0_g1~~TRINITY_DN635_c0_g1_i8.p1  ORF type:complete len:467 (-),score=147.86 TRINITY_DN635_c0_g1_i8:1309-2709(-)